MHAKFKVESVVQHGDVNLLHMKPVFEHDVEQKHLPSDHDWDHLRHECRGGDLHLTLYGNEAVKAFWVGRVFTLDFVMGAELKAKQKTSAG